MIDKNQKTMELVQEIVKLDAPLDQLYEAWDKSVYWKQGDVEDRKVAISKQLKKRNKLIFALAKACRQELNILHNNRR